MDESIKERCKSELAVYLVEEDGFRNWVWLPRMSLAELTSWWRSNTNISEFAVGLSAPYKLPGDMLLADTEVSMDFWYTEFKRTGTCKAWINSEDDSYLITSERQLVVDQAFPSDRLDAVRKRLSSYLDQEAQ
jgi:hypothetical protein